MSCSRVLRCRATLMVAAVIYDESKDTLGITNYDALPVQLNGIRIFGKKK